VSLLLLAFAALGYLTNYTRILWLIQLKLFNVMFCFIKLVKLISQFFIISLL